MNKNKIISILPIFIGLGVAVGGLILINLPNSDRVKPLFLGELPPAITYKWEIPKSMSDRIPKNVSIYRFTAPKNPQDRVRELAEKFQIEGKVERTSSLLNPRWIVKSDRTQIYLDTDTGMWTYSRNLSSKNKLASVVSDE